MYEWTKAIHLIFVLIFCGGLIGLFIVSMVIGAKTPKEIEIIGRLRDTILKWDGFVTLPALGLVWAFGIWTAVMGGWFSEVWLLIKLIFVVALSGFHGVLRGRLRRMDMNVTSQTGTLPLATIGFILFSLSAIAVMVVLKPF